MDDPYFVGHDTIIWTFTGEYTTGVTTCEQYIFIQSDLEPIAKCDSLKKAVITKLIAGACETSSASLNIQTPSALDACLRVPYMGVGRRTSGRAMDDPYYVGQDTIIWSFSGRYTLVLRDDALARGLAACPDCGASEYLIPCTVLASK